MLQEPVRNYEKILKKRRKVRGITLNELSERTRIGRTNLDEAEQGRVHLTEEERERIEKFLRRQRII